MAVGTNKRKVRAAATRASLVAAARQLFAIEGYYVTGTHELVSLAGVTRGALYHHFADKEALFETVFRDTVRELSGQATAAVESLAGDPWAQLVGAIREYLRLVAESGQYQRVILLDGPVVFGWARWREIQSEYTLAPLIGGLQLLMDIGLVVSVPPRPLAHLILAALYDAALSISHAPFPETARGEAEGALITLVEGLRRNAGGRR